VKIKNFQASFFTGSKWREVQDVGKRKAKCVGNGKEREWRKKNV